MFKVNWEGLGGSCRETGVFTGLREAGYPRGARRDVGVSRGPCGVGGSPWGCAGPEASPRVPMGLVRLWGVMGTSGGGWSPRCSVGRGCLQGSPWSGVATTGQNRTRGVPVRCWSPAPAPTSPPMPRWCRREVDEQRRETVEHRGEMRVLEQRSPWGLLRFGCLGQPLTQHLLPYARTLPLPLFAPPDLRGAKAGVPRTLSRSLSHEAQRG